MPVIPNTNTPNLVLTSVGDGQNSSIWASGADVTGGETPLGFAIYGSIVNDTMPGIYIPVPSGAVVTLVAVIAVLTSGTIDVQLTQNGSTVAGLGAVSVSSTSTGRVNPSSGVSVSDGDYFTITTSSGATPVDLSFTMIFSGLGGGGQGPEGPSGPAGACGVAGTGACGVSGVPGACGVSGVAGAPGACGVSGVAGTAGACGVAGTAGACGHAGACGVSGTAGACGVSGVAGTAGACGVSGVAGACGVSGVSGVAGACGVSGISGVPGACGVSGAGLLVASAASASGAINTTETVLETLTIVAGATLAVGTVVRITVMGTCTATIADTSTFTIRAGTLGTTGDASVAAPTVASGTSGTAVPFKTVLEFTVRTTGSGGTAAGSMTVENQGVTGISTLTLNVVPFTSSTLATTTATKLSITYKSSATTCTCTFQNATIEVL